MDTLIFRDLMVLFGLGLAGWAIFYRFHLPVAPFLGSLTVLTVLRAFGVAVPLSPDWLFPVLQVCLGLYIGSKITRDVVRDIKPMLSAAIIIVVWALTVVFVMGPFLAWATSLDLYTAILSSSMGGLPEITMIAMATDANLSFIIMMQMVRMIITVAVFPIILKRWMAVNQPEVQQLNGRVDLVSVLNGSGVSVGSGTSKSVNEDKSGIVQGKFPVGVKFDTGSADAGSGNSDNGKVLSDDIYDSDDSDIGEKLTSFSLARLKSLVSLRSLAGSLPAIAAAACGGAFLHYLGVPAGIMVGSTIAVGAVSLSGLKPVNISPPAFNLMLVALGIAVSDNIVPSEFAAMGEPVLLWPVLIATTIIFISSMLVTLLIHKISGWDLPTSFLAAAPGGFSVMVALSVRYDKDPFRVSMLHLCRLLSIKIALPFVFMYLA